MAPHRIDADVLNLLRRAHKLLEDSEPSSTSTELSAAAAPVVVLPEEARLEMISNVVEQLQRAEHLCAMHVFGSVALARVLRCASDAQRVRLGRHHLPHPLPHPLPNPLPPPSTPTLYPTLYPTPNTPLTPPPSPQKGETADPFALVGRWGGGGR